MTDVPTSNTVSPALISPLARLRRWVNNAGERGSIAPFLCVYAPLAWLTLLILPTRPPAPGLDLSWQAILHYGATHHWQYGVDAMFTYGPLGYLHCTAQYFHDTSLSCIVYQLVFKAFYVALICRLCTRLPRGNALLFVLADTILPMADDDSIYLLAIGFAALLICEKNEPRFWKGASVALLAVSMLIKGTFLVYSGGVIGLIGVYLLSQRVREAGEILAAFLLCFLVAYVGYAGQNLLLLPRFLGLSLNVISGYPLAMNLELSWEALAGGLAVAACVLVRVAWFAKRSDAPLGLTATFLPIVGAGLFLAWKAGFTRNDVAHQPTFFAYALALASAAPVFFPAGVRAAGGAPINFFPFLQTLAPVIAVWALCVQYYSGNHYPPSERLDANTGWLLTPRAQEQDMETLVRNQGPALDLPRCRAVVGRSSLDMFGCQQVVVVANGFNYRPAPIFQPYNAYTPRLIQVNTAFYQSDKAPDFVLFKPLNIDDRFPTLDNAGVLLELLRNYQPVLDERGVLLLKRQPSKQAQPSPTAKLLAGGKCSFGEKIALPKTAGAIWCRADIHLNLLGRLVGFFYHSPIFNLVGLSPDGIKKSVYRLVPGMASEGFLLTPFVSSAPEYVQLQSGHPTEGQQISAIGFTSAYAWTVHGEIEYQFYDLPPFSPPAGEDR